MKLYTLTTIFTFGRHQGQTVAEVLVENPGYLKFCLQVLSHFALRRAEVEAWQQQYPKLKQQLTDAAWAKLDEKERQLQGEQTRWQPVVEEYYTLRDDPDHDFDWSLDGYFGDCDDAEWLANLRKELAD